MDQRVTVLVIGGGAGGICMGARLLQAGITDFAILEKSSAVGGTWFDNTYPGAECDVPSHLYSFSFLSNRTWSARFAPQPEILAYFARAADELGVTPHVHLNTSVTAMTWDDQAEEWDVRSSLGTYRARYVVSALGQLNVPFVPDFPGREQFTGIQFHSSRWDHDVDLTNLRVGVVGNAASALQFIPRVAEQVGELTVFQRSANWVLPRKNRRYSRLERFAFSHVPGFQRLYRWWIYWRLELMYLLVIRRNRLTERIEKILTRELERLVSDDLPREALVPDYPMGCRRVLISDDYYKALCRPNVHVVTDHIDAMTPNGIRTTDGTERELDVVIFGTGFQTTKFMASIAVTGSNGTRLAERWEAGAYAHRGVCLDGFPNFFLIYGPNTNLGHNSILFMIESQTRYITNLISMCQERGSSIEPAFAAIESFNRDVQVAASKTVFSSGCGSWYVTADGRVTNNWPLLSAQYWREMRSPVESEYTFRRRSGAITRNR